MRVLVSQMRGAVNRLGYLTSGIAPPDVVDLTLGVMCAASYKDKFTDILKGMKNTTTKKIFRLNHSGNMYTDTLESIFADNVRIYD